MTDFRDREGNTFAERLSRRLADTAVYRWDDPIRINTPEELAEFQRQLGNGWHEPDQWDLDAFPCGGSFDNAGFWGFKEWAYQAHEEMHVVFMVRNDPVAAVNVANLCDWASERRSS